MIKKNTKTEKSLKFERFSVHFFNSENEENKCI